MYTAQASSPLKVREAEISESESFIGREYEDSPDINWDQLEFGIVRIDHMYIMKCSKDGEFAEGQLAPYGNIQLSPSSGVLNYGQVLKAQSRAKKRGFSDVLFLDSVNKKYLEEGASSNIFLVKNNVISTPPTEGTILAGITRKSIIEIARDRGYQVEERQIAVDELFEADEAFCTGTAVVIALVGSVTYCGRRMEYKKGVGTISQDLYSTLTNIQMGLVEDKKGWTVEIDRLHLSCI